MKVDLLELGKGKSGQQELSKAIYGLAPRADIIHRVVCWQLAKRQSGTHKTKTISEISGTTAKPFRQKGTGNARQGSRRAVQMRGGATSFGPVPRSHAHNLPKKIRALGLKHALSSKCTEKSLSVLKQVALKTAKTKDFVASFAALGHKGRILLIDGVELDAKLKSASANIANVNLLPANGANVYDIMHHEHVLLTENAVKHLEERLG